MKRRLLGIGLLALATSTYLQDDLWIDEQITIDIVARHDLWSIFTQVPLHQPHLPTYYALVEIIGISTAHTLSALAFAGTAIATYYAALEYHGHGRRAFASSLLVSLSPFLARQAGWVRMYSLLTFVLTIALAYHFAGRQYRATGLIMLAGFLHPFALLPMAWHWFASRGKGWLRRQPLYFIGILPTLALGLIKYLGPKAGVTRLDVTHPVMPTIEQATVTPLMALFGTHYTNLQLWAMLGFMLLLAIRHWRTDLISYVAVGVGGVVAASAVIHPLYRAKYFGFIAPVMAIWIFADGKRSRFDWYEFVLLNILLWSMWMWAILGFKVGRYGFAFN